ncbi:MAG: ATP-grasp domain-containing protein [Gemmatimonadota bacterium]
MSRTVLITVGRMPKGLDLARGFAAEGCRVVVADPYRWHVARLSRAVAATHRTVAPAREPDRYLEQLSDLVARERVELVVPVSEETMHVVRLGDRLPAGTRLFAGPAALVHTLHDKWRFNRLAATFGLPVPPSAPLGDDAARAVVEAGPAVVKPIWSCGGAGVEFLEHGAPLPAARAAGPALVQQRVDGTHLSTCSVAVGGRVLGTTVYRGVVMAGTVAVCFRRVADARAIEAWVEAFVARTGYSGFVSFDFIVAGDGTPYAIECNPRVTSGMHFFDHPAVARAVLSQGASGPVPHRPETHLQHFYATLMEAEGALLSGRPSREQFVNLWQARDVVWAPRDPLPFWGMTPASYELLAKSLFGKMSMGEAATGDIGWFGPPPMDLGEVPAAPRPVGVTPAAPAAPAARAG